MKTTTIVRLALVDENGYGETLAFRNMRTDAREADGAWIDPHGGQFSADDQAALDCSARGEVEDVVTGVGTPFERRYQAVRLVARFALPVR